MGLNDKRQAITRDYERCVLYLPKWAKELITEQAKTQSISISKYLADIVIGGIEIEESHLDGTRPQ